MAIVDNTDHTKRRGKLNKKDDAIFRVINGKEYVYSIKNPNTEPPSKSQNAHRSLFGKVNAVVNVIMADPKQVAEWRKRMEEHNRSIPASKTAERAKTVRQFVFASLAAQYKQKPSVRRKFNHLPITIPKNIKRVIKLFADLTPAELYEMLKARFNVFYIEQDCKYPDLDDIDYRAEHIALFRRGKVIAYCRLFPADSQWHVGRMLTVPEVRGKGYGKYLMTLAVEEAGRQGAQSVSIDAQTHAVDFYAALGFRTVSDVFIEAGIPHVRMVRTLIE